MLDTIHTGASESGAQPRRRQPSDGAVGAALLAAFLVLAAAYHGVFTVRLDSYVPESGLWQATLNPDHEIYVAEIDRLRDGAATLALGNDLGIAAIYLALSSLLPGAGAPDYVLLSLFVNCLTLCACYVVYARICDQLGLGLAGKLTFFANAYFIYFAQLVNKDLFTILGFLVMVHLGIKGRARPLLLLVPVLLLVRLQLAVLALVFVFFLGGRRPRRRIALAYVVSSLAAGLLAAFVPVITAESLGDGLSAYLVDLNRRYFVGYLLFNPLRVVQYVTDALSSFAFVTPNGGVDVARLLRVPQLALLLVLVRPLSTLVTRFGHWLETPARSLVLAVVAYLIVWLMNPTVNARYVMLITPVLMLFALYARAAAERGETARAAAP